MNIDGVIIVSAVADPLPWSCRCRWQRLRSALRQVRPESTLVHLVWPRAGNQSHRKL